MRQDLTEVKESAKCRSTGRASRVRGKSKHKGPEMGACKGPAWRERRKWGIAVGNEERDVCVFVGVGWVVGGGRLSCVRDLWAMVRTLALLSTCNISNAT